MVRIRIRRSKQLLNEKRFDFVLFILFVKGMNKQDRILQVMKRATKRKSKSSWLIDPLIDLFDIEFKKNLKKDLQSILKRANSIL